MSKTATGETLQLDIRNFARRGYLMPDGHAAFKWQWSNGANIDCHLSDHEALLDYNWRDEPVSQRVAIEWTPCNYGGRRAWWNCPSCHGRVAILYSAGKYFACRHCYQLCYFSQQERKADRLLRRAWKIRRRLGQVEGGHMERVPDKPKGMHYLTYYKLMNDCYDYETENFAITMAAFGFGTIKPLD
jgi:hypothetical protein